VNNVERLVDGLGVDLHTEVIDWLEMRDLQLAWRGLFRVRGSRRDRLGWP
jgi:hypothetical protein